MGRLFTQLYRLCELKKLRFKISLSFPTFSFSRRSRKTLLCLTRSGGYCISNDLGKNCNWRGGRDGEPETLVQ